MPTAPRLVFLTYLSRSGSTFLASELDRFPEVSVSLEARLPDGMLHDHADLERLRSVEALIRTLYEDEKLRAWEIPRERLAERLAGEPLPIPFDRLLPLLLELSPHTGGAPIRVYKAGEHVFHLDRLRRLFPNAGVLFLMRDPRAIYNSQRTNRDSLGHPMARTPIGAARLFVRACRALEAHADAPWLEIVRYERLLAEPDAVRDQLATFLGLADRTPGDHGYAGRIPTPQQHLHRNVGGSPRADRIHAWRNELPPAHQYCLEWWAGREMEAHGYPPERTGANIRWRARSWVWVLETGVYGLLRRFRERRRRAKRAAEDALRTDGMRDETVGERG